MAIGAGDKQALWTAVVVVAGIIYHIRGEIIEGPRNEAKVVGSSVSLRCSTSAGKACTDIQWLRTASTGDRRPVNISNGYDVAAAYRDRFSVQDDAGACRLRLTRLEGVDAGLYHCQENTSASRQTRSGFLIVITDHRCTYKNQTQVEYSCQMTFTGLGFGPIRTWIRWENSTGEDLEFVRTDHDSGAGTTFTTADLKLKVNARAPFAEEHFCSASFLAGEFPQNGPKFIACSTAEVSVEAPTSRFVAVHLLWIAGVSLLLIVVALLTYFYLKSKKRRLNKVTANTTSTGLNSQLQSRSDKANSGPKAGLIHLTQPVYENQPVSDRQSSYYEEVGNPVGIGRPERFQVKRENNGRTEVEGPYETVPHYLEIVDTFPPATERDVVSGQGIAGQVGVAEEREYEKLLTDEGREGTSPHQGVYTNLMGIKK